jgi:hypothetical protein
MHSMRSRNNLASLQSIHFKADFYKNRTSGFDVGEGSVVPLKVDGFHGLATATAKNGAPDHWTP